MATPGTTTSQEAANGTQEEDQHLEAPVGTGQADDAGVNEPGSSDDEIPVKFINKSPLEIIRSYKELEKHAGKVGSEKAQAEAALEQERQRRLQLEQEFQNQSRQQAAPNHPQQTEQDYDPASVLDRNWNDSPKDAIKAALGTIVGQVGNAFTQQRQQAMQSATAARWEEIKRRNPEEAKELEPVMVQLSSRISRIVRPDQIQSPDALDALYDLARAQTMDKRVEEGVKRKLEAKAAVTTEKRAAFSEGGNTQGDSQSKSFETLSREEMRKALGVSDKY